jgi:hypothetical protein
MKLLSDFGHTEVPIKSLFFIAFMMASPMPFTALLVVAGVINNKSTFPQIMQLLTFASIIPLLIFIISHRAFLSRARKGYGDYLQTVPKEVIIANLSTSELDQDSRDCITEHLNRHHAGWARERNFAPCWLP